MVILKGTCKCIHLDFSSNLRKYLISYNETSTHRKNVGNSSILRVCIYTYAFLSPPVYLILEQCYSSSQSLLYHNPQLSFKKFIVKGMLTLKLYIYINDTINQWEY